MTDYVPDTFDRERWQPDTIIPKGARKQVRLHQFANEGLELREWYLGVDDRWYASRAFIKLKTGEALLLAQALTDAVQVRKGARGGYKGDCATPLPAPGIHRGEAVR